MVAASVSHPFLNTNLFLSFDRCSAASINSGFRRGHHASLIIRRTKGQTFRVLANPNVSSGKGEPKNLIMVDPLEAKRLAARQMEGIKARERLKKRREAEAINGAFAMIGLTAYLVIEGQTGKGILEQLADYWSAITHLFIR